MSKNWEKYSKGDKVNWMRDIVIYSELELFDLKTTRLHTVAWRPCCMVLVVSCLILLQVLGLDESIMQGVPGLYVPPLKFPFLWYMFWGQWSLHLDRLIHSFTAVIYVMFSVLKIVFLRGTLTSGKRYCSNVVCWSSDAANWCMHPETYHVMMFFYNFVNVTINLSYDGRQ